jgi:ABC-type transport system involved in multi-copper enzyme maturation permease subunit
MIWVTWRQHRTEGLWTFLAVAIMAAGIAVVLYELTHAPLADCPPAGPGGICLPGDGAGALAQWILKVNLINYGIVVLPGLAGAFIGAPLVAAEIENGTHRLAWTQGVTRARWLFSKLTLLFVPLLGAAAVVGIMEVYLINAMGSQPNHWNWFDQQAPVVVGATLLAMALGLASGALIGRSIQAMAATLIGYVGVRFCLGVFVRANYMSPVLFTSHDPAALNTVDPTAWWLDQPAWRDAAGRTISQGGAPPIVSATPVDPVTYYRDHGISMVQYFQPADRFWTFQGIETGILVALSVVLLAIAVYWVMRRVS